MPYFEVRFLGNVAGDDLPPLTDGAGTMLQKQLDWNGDGFLDLFVFNGTFPPVSESAEIPWVLLSDGLGGFASAPNVFRGPITGTVHPRQAEFADFDGDDKLDIFVADHGYDADPFPGHENSLYLQAANGQLFEANNLLPGFTDFSHALTSGDIDGDGDIDILVMNLSSKDGPFSYFLVNDGGANFAVRTNELPDRFTTSEILSLKTVLYTDLFDFDLDGHLDLLVGAEQAFDQPSEIILNDGKGNFPDENTISLPLRTDRTQYDNPQSLQAMAPLDLNGDGHLDLFLSYGFGAGTGGSVQTLINNGDGTYRDETVDRFLDGFVFENEPAFFLTQVDVNHDGYADIVNNEFSASSPIAWINDGEGYFSTIYADAEINNGGSWVGALPGTAGVLNYLEVFVFEGAAGQNLIAQNAVISTGPDFRDPETLGVKGFNEAYYLRTYLEAAASVAQGTYSTGIEHYIAEGRTLDFRIAANIGNEEDNRLTAGSFGSDLFGKGGNDYIVAGEGVDLIDGGSGIDALSYEHSSVGVEANLDTGIAVGGYGEGDLFAEIENLFGSQSSDLLRGDGLDNYIAGLDGADALFGRGGADLLDGGDGDDVLRGNTGDDVLAGGLGGDFIDGGVGLDTVDYSDALEAILVDLLTVNSRNNAGGALGDTLKLIEAAIGSAFDDEILGSSRGNVIDGGAGDDALIGRNGNDELNGGFGDDRLFGGNNADLMRGQAGNDLLYGGDGRDTLIGGAGSDDLRGQAGDDVLSGDANDDALYGYAGADELRGGTGNDLLDGAVGKDVLYGGDGDDDLLGGNNDDYLNGGAGNDTLVGGSGADVYAFSALEPGTDRVIGLDGVDSLVFSGFGYANAADVLGFMRVHGNSVEFEDQGVSIVFSNRTIDDIEVALKNATSSFSGSARERSVFVGNYEGMEDRKLYRNDLIDPSGLSPWRDFTYERIAELYGEDAARIGDAIAGRFTRIPDAQSGTDTGFSLAADTTELLPMVFDPSVDHVWDLA